MPLLRDSSLPAAVSTWGLVKGEKEGQECGVWLKPKYIPWN